VKPAAPKQPNAPLLMQRKAAAALLGISVAQFWRLEKRGEIPTGARLPGFRRGVHWHRDTLTAIAAKWAKP